MSVDPELKSLTDGITAFASWGHAEKIRFFAWFQKTVKGKPTFTTRDISGFYDAFGYGRPNVSQFLKDMAERKPAVLLRRGEGFVLEGKIREDYDRKYLARPNAKAMSEVEAGIFKALDEVIPTTSLSYKQVLQDLNVQNRVSYRGTAAELREVVRELLDHLAPDDEVLKTVKLDPTQKRPSMKQKATFILKKRGVGDTTRKTAEDAVNAVENSVGSLARSVYDRGSISTHIATTRVEVLTFKGYAEAVLAELLQIHQ